MTEPRIAAAPISWGVCEVPGWGHQLAPDRVLADMRDLGIRAAETGPEGFLPSDPARLRKSLDAYGIRCVGAFVPLVLHDPDIDPAIPVTQAIERLGTSGGDVIVLAATGGSAGYDTRPELSASQWRTLLGNLDRLDELVTRHGMTAVLHPHIGTMVEHHDEVTRILNSSGIGLCLDTGHLLVGGIDPLDLAAAHTDRIRHVHLKDVRDDLAARVRRGELAYTEAVARGMYVPLGRGDTHIAEIVETLVGAGYNGWLVLEQDTILADASGAHGATRHVAESLSYLRTISAAHR